MGQRYTIKIKSICLVLTFTFLLSDLSYAAPIEAITFPESPIQSLLNDPSRFEAPVEFCRFKETHKGPPQSAGGQAPPLIIHVQDAHVNLSGQENLARALDAIMAKYPVNLVLVEGGTRDDTLTPIKSVAPPEVWKRVAKKFLMEGKISGEEYLNLTSDNPMKIMGIEDKALYMKSLESYAELADKREAILGYLKSIQVALEKTKRKLYPKELLDYEREAGNKTDDFEKRIESLLGLSIREGLKSFPSIEKLAVVQDQEKEIDFKLANLEQAALVEEITGRGGALELKSHLDRASRMKNERLSQFAYFQNTLNMARRKNVDISKYPNLILYGDYLKEFSAIDFDALLTEMEKLENQVYLSRLTTQDSRLIRSIDRYLSLLTAAYSIQMSTKEFKTFLANEPDFSTLSYLAFVNRKLAELGYAEDLVPYASLLEEGRRSLAAFYDSVAERDLAFMKNAERILKEEDQKVAVLIAGGYHTPHLKELFKEKGYSYLVLTPHVSSETNQAKYERLLLEPVRKEVKTVAVSEGKKNHEVRPGAAVEGVRFAELATEAADMAGTSKEDLASILLRVATAGRELRIDGGRFSARELLVNDLARTDWRERGVAYALVPSYSGARGARAAKPEWFDAPTEALAKKIAGELAWELNRELDQPRRYLIDLEPGRTDHDGGVVGLEIIRALVPNFQKIIDRQKQMITEASAPKEALVRRLLLDTMTLKTEASQEDVSMVGTLFSITISNAITYKTLSKEGLEILRRIFHRIERLERMLDTYANSGALPTPFYQRRPLGVSSTTVPRQEIQWLVHLNRLVESYEKNGEFPLQLTPFPRIEKENGEGGRAAVYRVGETDSQAPEMDDSRSEEVRFVDLNALPVGSIVQYSTEHNRWIYTLRIEDNHEVSIWFLENKGTLRASIFKVGDPDEKGLLEVGKDSLMPYFRYVGGVIQPPENAIDVFMAAPVQIRLWKAPVALGKPVGARQTAPAGFSSPQEGAARGARVALESGLSRPDFFGRAFAPFVRAGKAFWSQQGKGAPDVGEPINRRDFLARTAQGAAAFTVLFYSPQAVIAKDEKGRIHLFFQSHGDASDFNAIEKPLQEFIDQETQAGRDVVLFLEFVTWREEILSIVHNSLFKVTNLGKQLFGEDIPDVKKFERFLVQNRDELSKNKEVSKMLNDVLGMYIDVYEEQVSSPAAIERTAKEIHDRSEKKQKIGFISKQIIFLERNKGRLGPRTDAKDQKGRIIVQFERFTDFFSWLAHSGSFLQDIITDGSFLRKEWSNGDLLDLVFPKSNLKRVVDTVHRQIEGTDKFLDTLDQRDRKTAEQMVATRAGDDISRVLVRGTLHSGFLIPLIQNAFSGRPIRSFVNGEDTKDLSPAGKTSLSDLMFRDQKGAFPLLFEWYWRSKSEEPLRSKGAREYFEVLSLIQQALWGLLISRPGSNGKEMMEHAGPFIDRIRKLAPDETTPTRLYEMLAKMRAGYIMAVMLNKRDNLNVHDSILLSAAAFNALREEKILSEDEIKQLLGDKTGSGIIALANGLIRDPLAQFRQNFFKKSKEEGKKKSDMRKQLESEIANLPVDLVPFQSLTQQGTEALSGASQKAPAGARAVVRKVMNLGAREGFEVAIEFDGLKVKVQSIQGSTERDFSEETTPITVGRGHGNDVRLSGGNVSGKHGQIIFREGKFYYVDLDSTNGTFFEGKWYGKPGDTNEVFLYDVSPEPQAPVGSDPVKLLKELLKSQTLKKDARVKIKFDAKDAEVPLMFNFDPTNRTFGLEPDAEYAETVGSGSLLLIRDFALAVAMVPAIKVMRGKVKNFGMKRDTLVLDKSYGPVLLRAKKTANQAEGPYRVEIQWEGSEDNPKARLLEDAMIVPEDQKDQLKRAGRIAVTLANDHEEQVLELLEVYQSHKVARWLSDDEKRMLLKENLGKFKGKVRVYDKPVTRLDASDFVDVKDPVFQSSLAEGKIRAIQIYGIKQFVEVRGARLAFVEDDPDAGFSRNEGNLQEKLRGHQEDDIAKVRMYLNLALLYRDWYRNVAERKKNQPSPMAYPDYLKSGKTAAYRALGVIQRLLEASLYLDQVELLSQLALEQERAAAFLDEFLWLGMLSSGLSAKSLEDNSRSNFKVFGEMDLSGVKATFEDLGPNSFSFYADLNNAQPAHEYQKAPGSLDADAWKAFESLSGKMFTQSAKFFVAVASRSSKENVQVHHHFWIVRVMDDTPEADEKTASKEGARFAGWGSVLKSVLRNPWLKWTSLAALLTAVVALINSFGSSGPTKPPAPNAAAQPHAPPAAVNTIAAPPQTMPARSPSEQLKKDNENLKTVVDGWFLLERSQKYLDLLFSTAKERRDAITLMKALAALESRLGADRQQGVEGFPAVTIAQIEGEAAATAFIKAWDSDPSSAAYQVIRHGSSPAQLQEYEALAREIHKKRDTGRNNGTALDKTTIDDIKDKLNADDKTFFLKIFSLKIYFGVQKLNLLPDWTSVPSQVHFRIEIWKPGKYITSRDITILYFYYLLLTKDSETLVKYQDFYSAEVRKLVNLYLLYENFYTADQSIRNIVSRKGGPGFDAKDYGQLGESYKKMFEALKGIQAAPIPEFLNNVWRDLLDRANAEFSSLWIYKRFETAFDHIEAARKSLAEKDIEKAKNELWRAKATYGELKGYKKFPKNYPVEWRLKRLESSMKQLQDQMKKPSRKPAEVLKPKASPKTVKRGARAAKVVDLASKERERLGRIRDAIEIQESKSYVIKDSPDRLLLEVADILETLDKNLKNVRDSIRADVRAYLLSNTGTEGGKMTLTDLSESSGVSASYLSMLRGEGYSGVPSKEIQEKIAEGFGVELEAISDKRSLDPDSDTELVLEKAISEGRRTFGRLLDLALDSYGISQKETAEKARVERASSISHAILGRSELSVRRVKDIAQAVQQLAASRRRLPVWTSRADSELKRQVRVTDELIGAEVRRLRKEKRLTQEELREKAEAPFLDMTAFESGYAALRPDDGTLERIALALGTTIENIRIPAAESMRKENDLEASLSDHAAVARAHVKKMRTEAGVSQKVLAEKLRVSQKVYQHVESGKHPSRWPIFQHIPKLAELLNVSPADLWPAEDLVEIQFQPVGARASAVTVDLPGLERRLLETEEEIKARYPGFGVSLVGGSRYFQSGNRKDVDLLVVVPEGLSVKEVVRDFVDRFNARGRSANIRIMLAKNGGAIRWEAKLFFGERLEKHVDILPVRRWKDYAEEIFADLKSPIRNRSVKGYLRLEYFLGDSESFRRAVKEFLGRPDDEVVRGPIWNERIGALKSGIEHLEPGTDEYDQAIDRIVERLKRPVMTEPAQGARSASRPVLKKLEEDLKAIDKGLGRVETTRKINHVLSVFKKKVWKTTRAGALILPVPKAVELYNEGLKIAIREIHARASEKDPLLKKAVLTVQGSLARGLATARSDVELMWVMPKEALDKEGRLSSEWAETIGEAFYWLFDSLGQVATSHIATQDLDQLDKDISREIKKLRSEDSTNSRGAVELVTGWLGTKFIAGDENFYREKVDPFLKKELARYATPILGRVILGKSSEYDEGRHMSGFTLFKSGLGGFREGSRIEWLLELEAMGETFLDRFFGPKKHTPEELRAIREAYLRQAVLRDRRQDLARLDVETQVQYLKDAILLFDENVKLMERLWPRVRDQKKDPAALRIFLASPSLKPEMSPAEEKRILGELKPGDIKVVIKPTAVKGVHVLTVIADESGEGLLGKVAGTIGVLNHLNIQAAQIHSPDRHAFNHFWVEGVPGQEKEQRRLERKIEQELRIVIYPARPEDTVKHLAESRGIDYRLGLLGDSREIPTIVYVEPQGSNFAVTFLTQERNKPGLLSRIAEQWGQQKINIVESGQIRSQGSVVIDSLVIDKENGKPISLEHAWRIANELKEFLDQPILEAPAGGRLSVDMKTAMALSEGLNFHDSLMNAEFIMPALGELNQYRDELETLNKGTDDPVEKRALGRLLQRAARTLSLGMESASPRFSKSEAYYAWMKVNAHFLKDGDFYHAQQVGLMMYHGLPPSGFVSEVKKKLDEIESSALSPRKKLSSKLGLISVLSLEAKVLKETVPDGQWDAFEGPVSVILAGALAPAPFDETQFHGVVETARALEGAIFRQELVRKSLEMHFKEKQAWLVRYLEHWDVEEFSDGQKVMAAAAFAQVDWALLKFNITPAMNVNVLHILLNGITWKEHYGFYNIRYRLFAVISLAPLLSRLEQKKSTRKLMEFVHFFEKRLKEESVPLDYKILLAISMISQGFLFEDHGGKDWVLEPFVRRGLNSRSGDIRVLSAAQLVLSGSGARAAQADFRHERVKSIRDSQKISRQTEDEIIALTRNLRKRERLEEVVQQLGRIRKRITHEQAMFFENTLARAQEKLAGEASRRLWAAVKTGENYPVVLISIVGMDEQVLQNLLVKLAPSLGKENFGRRTLAENRVLLGDLLNGARFAVKNPRQMTRAEVGARSAAEEREPERFAQTLGVRLGQGFVTLAQAREDQDTQLLLARVLERVGARSARSSEVRPFAFEKGNTLVGFRGDGVELFASSEGLTGPTRSLAGGRLISLGTIPFAPEILAEARRLNRSGTDVPQVRLAEREISGEPSPALEAFTAAERIARLAARGYAKAGISGARTVILRLATDKELTPVEIQVYLNQIGRVRGIAGANVFLQFAVKQGARFALYGPSEVPAGLARKDYELIYMAEPSEAVLNQAQGEQAGFAALESVGDGAMFPFIGAGIFAVAAARIDSPTEWLIQLWQNLRKDPLTDLDPEAFQAIKKVKVVDVIRYLKLAIRMITQMNWAVFSDYEKLLRSVLTAV